MIDISEKWRAVENLCILFAAFGPHKNKRCIVEFCWTEKYIIRRIFYIYIYRNLDSDPISMYCRAYQIKWCRKKKKKKKKWNSCHT